VLKRGRGAVGPVTDPDEHNCQPHFGIIRSDHRQAGQIYAPTRRRVTGHKPHHVRMSVLGIVGQVLVLRHHVALGSWLKGRHFFRVQARSAVSSPSIVSL
jgi:hypothetical protein